MSIDGQILSYHQLIWWWDSRSVVTPVLVNHKQHLYLAVRFFRKSSLSFQLASQLSRGVLIDISCTNCDNGSSHCHIVSPAPGTWSLGHGLSRVTSGAMSRAEGGEWLLCLCLRSKTQAGAHYSLLATGHCSHTMHRRNSGDPGPGPREGSGHHRDTRYWLFVIVL